MKKQTIPFIALLSLMTPVASAAVPLSFTHHGVLKEDGVLVNDSKQVVVTLYAGNESISQKEGVIEFVDGHYTVVLDNIPVDKVRDANNLVLGVNIDGEELLPRLAIKSVPYALVAAHAQTAAALDCEGCISAKHLDFIASNDFQMPNCASHEILRATADGWQCSSAVKITDDTPETTTTYLRGKIGINTPEDGSFPAYVYQYVATGIGAARAGIAACACDESGESDCPAGGFSSTDDQGASCYDLVGSNYRFFERQNLYAPVEGLTVINNSKIGLGVGTPAANLHVRALNGANQYEMILADTQPEILLEDLDGDTANYKVALEEGQLAIYASDEDGQFNTPTMTINNDGLTVNGTLTATTLNNATKIDSSGVDFYYAASSSKGGPATSIANNTVDSSKIKDGTITSSDIKDGTIATADLANDAVTSIKIADGAISNTKLANASVSNEKLGPSSVTSEKIANLTILAEDLTDGAITTDKIADLAVTTKKIASKNITSDKLKDGAVITDKIKDGNVTEAKLADKAVSSGKIADGAIIEAKLADLAISSEKIAAGAIIEAKLANLAVSSGKIADGAITNAKIASGAVGETNIADGAVTNAKLASKAVKATNIADGAVGSTQIASGAVGSTQLAKGAVGSTQLADGAITNAKLTTGAVGETNIAAGAVTNAKLATKAVKATNIADGAVGSTQIASGAVGSTQLAKGAVGSTQLADGAVTNAKLTAGAVGETNIAAGAVTNAKLADSAVTTSKIAEGNVTTSKIAEKNVTTSRLADDAVTTTKILDGNVTTLKIEAGAVTTTRLADDAVTTTKILNGNVTTLKIAEKNVTTSRLDDKAVTNAKLATGAVTNAKLANGAVTQEKLNYMYPPKNVCSIQFSGTVTSYSNGRVVANAESWKVESSHCLRGKLSVSLEASTTPLPIFIVTLPNEMADTNYIVVSNGNIKANSQTTTGFRIAMPVYSDTSTSKNLVSDTLSFAIYGDLATSSN